MGDVESCPACNGRAAEEPELPSFLEGFRSWKQLWLGWYACYPEILTFLLLAIASAIIFGGSLVQRPATAIALVLCTAAAFVIAIRLLGPLPNERDALPRIDWTVGQRVVVHDGDDAWSGTIVGIEPETASIRADDDAATYQAIEFSSLHPHEDTDTSTAR